MNNGRINKNKKIVKKQNNVLVLNRKNEKKVRRRILTFLFVSVILIVIFFTLKSFKIKYIEFTGGENINVTAFEPKANELMGRNIFIADYNTIIKEIYSNPYVMKVCVKRSLPDKINIVIDEKKALFYIYNGKYVIFDNQGMVLEIDNQVKNGIIEITGVNIKEDIKKNDYVKLDKQHFDVINEISDLFLKNTSVLKPYRLDISNLSDLSVFVNDIEIKMGDLFNLKEKLNSAFNIIIEDNLADKSGYVDVSNLKLPVFNCK
ncbi:MAG: FtsQ-type POTRA domain-containing protein [Oscillospiraceae bacterium]|nr:FtsQ-type POTRA domain-containing protein [Oscillospiraceae bacterium]